MEMVQVQLPAELVRQIQETVPSSKTLEQIFAEAIQMWLDRQQQQKARTEAEKALRFLRQAGLVMGEEKQHAFAQSLRTTLEVDERPDREEVEAAMANLNPPLSQEIITLRGEH